MTALAHFINPDASAAEQLATARAELAELERIEREIPADNGWRRVPADQEAWPHFARYGLSQAAINLHKAEARDLIERLTKGTFEP
jgi:crotonobetainyl-CoA:carnitine CoA-transferase CaiB-like acyl-CoA transferase